MKMNKISIIANPKINGMREIEKDFENIIVAHGAEIIPCGQETELLISLGGDGTVLKGFRVLPSMKIPLLGLNFGKFGFLTIDCRNRNEIIEDVLSGKFRISPRLYLEGNIFNKTVKRRAGKALNEMLIFRKDIRMVEFELTLGSTIFYFKADGIIISTPTGSTAHSFSAGGPIVFPEDRSMIVVAFAPFTATWRNCVYEGERILLKPSRDCDIVLDGQEKIEIRDNELFEINPGKESFNLMVPPEWDFWRTLKEKFSWGKGLV
ncbi:MAG: NAD(+)/NADH kinase [Candidatus Omnitrophica bacterium]|nr:NAD(+)/NADH kinase [Candidatus Omnitrophota bacterium]MCM8827935.1 NAD(+)/NADH kinase [Candidatus Omnitrophota bacterium]